MNKGFTLIEVIISITIFGILTTILVPSFQNYKKSGEELSVRQTAMVIYNDAMTFINLQSENSINRYPLYGTSSTEYLGINNIASNSFSLFVRNMMSISKVLDYSKIKNFVSSEFSGFVNGVGFISVTANYKDSSKVIVEFKVVDNELNYKDVGVIYSIEYFNENGVSHKIEI